MMKRDNALRLLKGRVAESDIVVAVYQTLFDWMEISPRDLNYVSTGAMGQGSSHGLGLALANPGRRVIVLDGDGSLLMNLGALATIADAAPANLLHLVFVNGTYEVNGDHPVPAAGLLDFAAIALGCGYRDAANCRSEADLGDAFDRILGNQGPALLALGVERGAGYPRDYEYIHSPEARERFRRALNATDSRRRMNLDADSAGGQGSPRTRLHG